MRRYDDLARTFNVLQELVDSNVCCSLESALSYVTAAVVVAAVKPSPATATPRSLPLSEMEHAPPLNTFYPIRHSTVSLSLLKKRRPLSFAADREEHGRVCVCPEDVSRTSRLSARR